MLDAVRDSAFAIQVVFTGDTPSKRSMLPSPFASSSLTQVFVYTVQQSHTFHWHTESSPRVHSHALTPPPLQQIEHGNLDPKPFNCRLWRDAAASSSASTCDSALDAASAMQVTRD